MPTQQRIHWHRLTSHRQCGSNAIRSMCSKLSHTHMHTNVSVSFPYAWYSHLLTQRWFHTSVPTTQLILCSDGSRRHDFRFSRHWNRPGRVKRVDLRWIHGDLHWDSRFSIIFCVLRRKTSHKEWPFWEREARPVCVEVTFLCVCVCVYTVRVRVYWDCHSFFGVLAFWVDFRCVFYFNLLNHSSSPRTILLYSPRNQSAE